MICLSRFATADELAFPPKILPHVVELFNDCLHEGGKNIRVLCAIAGNGRANAGSIDAALFVDPVRLHPDPPWSKIRPFVQLRLAA
ncbi:hypothetical protein AB7828_30150 [Tardiphaga sp. 215_C5_N2_1]|uniref:hypothetical protein n=1 Tax=Tardiphaga sp. 215_C5_N2_1 TaxID=3240774 RepID=UPI003F8CAA13